jgi:hypothetical protein
MVNHRSLNATSSVKGDSYARDTPEAPKPRQPEIDYFVMAITSAKARVWHTPTPSA